MGLSLCLTIISIRYMFCDATHTTEPDSRNTTAIFTTTPIIDQSIYVAIYVSSSFILLAAIIFAGVFIYIRKRGGARFDRQESSYRGNLDVSSAAEHCGYRSSKKEMDNCKPKSSITPKEEPVYINVQGECSEPRAEGDRIENIYCNVDYGTQK